MSKADKHWPGGRQPSDAASGASGEDPTSSFHRYFELVLADTPALREEVYRIRFQVYCREMHFEREEDSPGGLEMDEFDARARHCLIRHRGSGQFAGCVRLVLADPQHPEAPFPFEKFCLKSIWHDILDVRNLPRHKIGEISRLAVTSAFRKRLGEIATPDGVATPTRNGNGQPERRHIPPIAIGLYFAVTAVGLLENLDGVFAMMEPRLARRLVHVGIKFSQVGSVVQYHGPRAPFYITRESLFANLKPEMRTFLEALRADLAPAMDG
jgi:N-acyl amino acid synthase of PEP-CTERM/exosortase system